MDHEIKPNRLNQFHFWFIPCFLLVAVPAGFAADNPNRIQFKKGSNSAVVEASIKGYKTGDYILRARAGQHMNISMATKHGATYFNIIAPGEKEVAMFNGSLSQNQYEGTVPVSGDYKVRVYMMRSAARRGEVARYRLEIILTGAGQSDVHTPNRDAKVRGTGFHATGNIPCSMSKGQPTGSCAFGVKRERSGNAVVTVTTAGQGTRVIFFEQGRAIGYAQSQADAVEFKATKEQDLNIIHIGDERYEIPDAVVTGG
jgi:hypothetical protein